MTDIWKSKRNHNARQENSACTEIVQAFCYAEKYRGAMLIPCKSVALCRKFRLPTHITLYHKNGRGINMEIVAILSLMAVLSLIPGIVKMYRDTRKLNAEIKRLKINHVRI